MEQNQSENKEQTQSVSFVVKFFATGFFSGYAPFASGTVSSAVGLLFLLIPGFSVHLFIIPATIVFFIIGGFVSGKMEQQFGQDPSIVTIDEIVGMWLSLWFVPMTYMNVALAFFIFRILDVLKPYPAGDFDKRRGGWNIMLDDVVAGLYTNIIIQIALRYI